MKGKRSLPIVGIMYRASIIVAYGFGSWYFTIIGRNVQGHPIFVFNVMLLYCLLLLYRYVIV